METRVKLQLDTDWQMGILPHQQARDLKITTFNQLEQVTRIIPALVPGCMEKDLMNAGLLEKNIFFGLNVLNVQELEENHAYYSVSFAFEARSNVRPYLVFEGLDTICEIYLNGVLLGKTDNMMISYRFEASHMQEGRNELLLHFLPSCIAARERPLAPGYYSHNLANYDMICLRKPPHMFGWDIAPRVISAGIWLPVYIEFVPEEHIEDCYVMTFSENGENAPASLEVYFELSIQAGLLTDYKLSIQGFCGDSHFEMCSNLRFTKGTLRIPVANAKLWWPRGYGRQSLYMTTIQLICKGQVIDTWEQQVGIRTVKLIRTAVTDDHHQGRFEFLINRKKVFIMGTNWVPLDPFHSNDVNRLDQALELVDDLGCNAIRCWGGNVYESEKFFDFCDRKGIMVWQDFAMACAVYPQDDRMFQEMSNEIIHVVKRLRRHPSIILWAGDNECDLLMSRAVGKRDPNANRLTRRLMKELLEFEDPVRTFLPSSPFYDGEGYVMGREYLSENHLWGPRDYYKGKPYTQSLCHFVSEIGYQGCPPVDSIKKFISAENLWPWQNNPEWSLHNGVEYSSPDARFDRLGLMANQISEMFGSIPDNLEEFSLASQICQAEALKFFIELFRQERSFRTGIIWWNLLDCWPMFSEAVVDYYFAKKLSYHFIKRSQKPFLLLVGEPSNWRQPVLAINDSTTEISFSYTVKDGETNEQLLSGKASIAPDSLLVLQHLDYSQGAKRFYILEWDTVEGCGMNHYLAGNPSFDLSYYVKIARRHQLM